MKTSSLSFRLIVLSALWTAIVLFVAGFALSNVFRSNAEDNFSGLLTAHLYNLIGAVEHSEAGGLQGEPNLGDPRFKQPFSGWYWSVADAGLSGPPVLASTSLAGSQLPRPDPDTFPFSEEYRRDYPAIGLQGESLVVAEIQVFVGEGERLYQFLVSANRQALESQISGFNRILIIFLGFFGLGIVLSTVFVVRFGLRPLDRAGRALAEVRRGERQNLEGEFPDEIRPLVTEINNLIDANRSVLERARTQVGNLAHALKTPIAVLLNEARSNTPELGQRVLDQTAVLRQNVDAYLNRARIAAQKDTISVRTPVQPVLATLVKVMRRLNPGLEYAVENGAPAEIVFGGEKQDLEEMLGNLLENASKYAKQKVVIEATESGVGEGQFQIVVSDDGPGLSPEGREKALERGARLDETVPGSGLGLSIVRDIVHEYGGTLALGESAQGGLEVRLTLSKAN